MSGAPPVLQRRPRARQATRRARFILVASRFHETLSRSLIDGALRTLARSGVARHDTQVLWVPGAFELPVAAASIAKSLRPEAIIALGCVVKGQTLQYSAIGHAVAQGLCEVSVQSRIPVTFGVILAESLAQAKARAGGRLGNRGSDAAMAALATVEMLRHLPANSAKTPVMVDG